MKAIWFISDLHLDGSRPHLVKEYINLLKSLRGNAGALYILGDFFEYWVGDDILDSPQGEIYLPVIQALRELSASGVKTWIMHGNRDFLLGEGFAGKTGATILREDSVVIDLFGKPALIMHGDTLCTDDVEYQQLRVMLRSQAWQQNLTNLSVEERIQAALQMREQSMRKTRQGKEEIMDVNQQTMEQEMRKHGVQLLIHGHTHRPAKHRFDLDGKPAQRIVLGDWYDKPGYLKVTPEEYELVY